MDKEKTLRIGVQVLKVVAGAGLIAAAMVAPNVIQVASLFINTSPGKKKYYPARITRALDRLRSKGLLRLVKQGNRGFYEVTEKGREYLARYVLGEMKIKKPRRWDGKWRILMFDIRETRKPTRENVRISLERLGFCRFQDSVWMYPYPCEEVLELLRTAHGVRTEVMYLTADRFMGDRDLLHAYGLPVDEE